MFYKQEQIISVTLKQMKLWRRKHLRSKQLFLLQITLICNVTATLDASHLLLELLIFLSH